MPRFFEPCHATKARSALQRSGDDDGSELTLFGAVSHATSSAAARTATACRVKSSSACALGTFDKGLVKQCRTGVLECYERWVAKMTRSNIKRPGPLITLRAFFFTS